MAGREPMGVVKPVVLVTGSQGLLGRYLVQAVAERAAVVTTARTGGEHPCDLADPAAVRALLASVRPQYVIHAAAMTNVDQCEVDPTAADTGNRLTTAHLVEAMPTGGRLVYISTDQVYPNTPGPHREGDEAPVNVYGASKLAGERAAAVLPSSLCVRTNLFGPSLTPGRASLSDFIIKSLTNRTPMTLFGDVWFSPLHLVTLANLLAELTLSELVGTYNVGSREGMTKAQLGLAIAAHLGLSLDAVRVGASSELPARAVRPLDLRLDVTRIEAALGRPMPTCAHEIALL